MRGLGALISLVAATVLPVVAAWVVGCSGIATPTVRGSGVVQTESRDVSGFSEVWLSGSGEVRVDVGPAESLTVEAEDNILPLLETRVSGRRLTLGTKPNVNPSPTRPIRYVVTTKDLTAIGVSGSGKFFVTGVDTRRLSAEISGSGSAKLSGRADEVSLDVSGSGDYDAAGLACRTADVHISGSGSAVVNAKDRVSAHVSGSGSVRYLGSPAVDQHVSGSGAVTPAPTAGLDR
jgi:hypothetical protein